MMRRMKLAAYMSEKKLAPEDLARLIGDASVSGIVKWMRNERVPRPDQQRRIFEVTDGWVTPNDFILVDASGPAPKAEAAA